MLFTKGAESAILPFTTSGEIEKTRLHVDEFALVRNCKSWESHYNRLRKYFFSVSLHTIMK